MISLSSIAFAPSSSKIKIAPRISTECHFTEKKQMKKILSLLIGELREKDSNPRPPAYEAGELPLLHLAMCAAYTARCLRPETMRFKDFYRQPIMFHCCTYFFRFCIHKPSKLLPDASIMFSQNNNTLLYCCYDIFNLYTVLIRIHTAEG